MTRGKTFNPSFSLSLPVKWGNYNPLTSAAQGHREFQEVINVQSLYGGLPKNV